MKPDRTEYQNASWDFSLPESSREVLISELIYMNKNLTTPRARNEKSGKENYSKSD
jgi:hypothetical protein